MKKSLLFGIGGIGIIVSAFIMWTQTQNSAAEWTTYSNAQDGYSIDYPSSWHDEGQSTYPGTILGSSTISLHSFSTQTDDTAAFPDASISVAVFTEDANRSLESIAADDEDRVEGATVSAYTPLKIDRAEAISYTIDASNTASEGGMILDALIRKGDTIYEFEGIANSDQYSDFLPIFNRSLQSITFIE